MRSFDELVSCVREPKSPAIDYLYFNRNISLEVLDNMKIGYDEKEVRIVITVFWEGNLVGWQKRAMDNTPMVKNENGSVRKPEKYKNSVGFNKSITLYNADNIDAK